MADNVQWIKLKVGMFDGNSFKKIKRAKIGGISYRDKLTAVWFELLDLAGKSNSNGYLIDNNEIPYQSFEDIAIMLDREEKEIELCMQYFINERMVEIIDNVYCLSNFVKYQNQDALDRIREQKRIAQAKWRERQKLGLIGQNVDTIKSTVESTQPSTDGLLSNSISNSKYNNIFNFWNSKKIIVHQDLGDKLIKAIDKALKDYSEEEIIKCIDRYNTVIKDPKYFFDYKWTLEQFLTRKEGISEFRDDGGKWNNYCKQTGQKQTVEPQKLKHSGTVL